MDEINIGSTVEISISGEIGNVTGIAKYLEHATQYYVFYKDGNGCAQEKWLTRGQLK